MEALWYWCSNENKVFLSYEWYETYGYKQRFFSLLDFIQTIHKSNYEECMTYISQLLYFEKIFISENLNLEDELGSVHEVKLDLYIKKNKNGLKIYGSHTKTKKLYLVH